MGKSNCDVFNALLYFYGKYVFSEWVNAGPYASTFVGDPSSKIMIKDYRKKTLSFASNNWEDPQRKLTFLECLMQEAFVNVNYDLSGNISEIKLQDVPIKNIGNKCNLTLFVGMYPTDNVEALPNIKWEISKKVRVTGQNLNRMAYIALISM